MRTLNVSISDVEYKQLGIKTNNMTFADIVRVVSKSLALKKLEKSKELAQQYGLSEMTMDEITDEVKAVRKSAKDRH